MQQIFVKTCSRTIALSCTPNDVILDVKNKVQVTLGISVEQQNMMYGPKYLSNSQSLRELNIHNESTLHLQPRVEAGMNENTGKRNSTTYLP